MMIRKRTVGRAAAAAVLAGSLCGCAMFRASVKEQDAARAPSITAKYDQNDLQQWAQIMADLILAHPFPPAGENQPILVDMGIQNRTSTHIDTKALTDTITMKLMEAGKVRLVNASRRDDLLKEQGYQLANCTEQTRTAIGKQLGAKYMLTGSLIEISEKGPRQVRVAKQEDVYYQLTVEITDLETGLIVLRKQKDRLRTASRPIIGW